MPSLLKNTKPVEVILDCDKDDDKPATFLVKRLTFGESKNLAINLEALSKSSAEEIYSSVDELLNELVVGWENMGDKEFGKDKVTDFVNFTESIEMCHKILRASEVKDEQKN